VTLAAIPHRRNSRLQDADLGRLLVIPGLICALTNLRCFR
jgi:hypothetical protein